MTPADVRTLVDGQVEPVIVEAFVSLAQELFQEGFLKGQQEGMRRVRELVLKLLRLKFGNVPASVVARVKAATDTDLDRWTERVLTANSLAGVLDG